MEKAHNDEQARMWEKDRKNYEDQERKLNDKIRNINSENRKFLESQMQERTSAKNQRMNLNEHLLNKQLLREINGKREQSQALGSVHG